MQMIPSFFGVTRRRNSAFDPFSNEAWAQGFPSSSSESVRELRMFDNTRVNRDERWKMMDRAILHRSRSLQNVASFGRDEDMFDEDLQEVEEGRIPQNSIERAVEHEERIDTWIRTEMVRDRFPRRFRLQENVKLEEGKTSMEDGEWSAYNDCSDGEGEEPEVKNMNIDIS